MAAVATITVSGTVKNQVSGSKTIGPVTLASANANGTVIEIELANGANTITVPTTPPTSGVIIQLPSDNTAIVTLKGAGGDTGIAIGKTTKQVLNWDPAAAPANFVLNSASAQTGKLTEITFF